MTVVPNHPPGGGYLITTIGPYGLSENLSSHAPTVD